MKIGNLFVGAQRTNDTSPKWMIASWVHANGYWRWALFWSPYLEWKPRAGPGMAMGRRFRIGGRLSAWACIPLLGDFHFATQPAWRRQ